MYLTTEKRPTDQSNLFLFLLTYKQHSFRARTLTRRIFVYFAKYLSSVPFCKCERRFSSHQNFVKQYQTSKGPSSCLRAGQIVVKRQNCQILQLAGVKMAENVNEGNLISLFSNYTFSRSIKYFGVFKVRARLANSKLGGDKICRDFCQSQTNLFNLVRTGPNMTQARQPSS